MVVHKFNLSTQEAEIARDLCKSEDSLVCSKLQVRQGHMVKLCLKNKNKNREVEYRCKIPKSV